MKVNSHKVPGMLLEFLNSQMVPFIKAIGKITSLMVKDNMIGEMVPIILVIIFKTKCTDSDNYLTRMVGLIKVTIRMIKKVAKVSSHGLMDEYITDVG